MNHQWNVAFTTESENINDRINHFFRGRKNFECSKDSFDYFNLDTGAFFSFNLNDENCVVSLSIDLKTSNSNTIREAINEIQPLLKKFKLKVQYPEKGCIKEDFIPKRFIQKWHLIKRDYLDFHYDNVYYSVPSKKVKDVWYWNYSSQWTGRFLKNLFRVPKVQFFKKSGKAQTIVTINLSEWSAVPEADFYKLQTTQVKGIFRTTVETVEKIVSRKDMQALFEKCRFLPFERTPFYKFRPEDHKSQLKAIFNISTINKVVTLEPGKIIDKEIYEGKSLLKLEESAY